MNEVTFFSSKVSLVILFFPFSHLPVCLIDCTVFVSATCGDYLTLCIQSGRV